MNSFTVFVGLMVFTSSHALPIGGGFAGISLAPGPLNTFYSQEVTFAKLPVNVGFGWDRDGTLTVGLRFESKLRGQPLPVSLSASCNIRDPKRTFKFEFGTRLLDKLSGVVYGDKDGLKWLSSLWLPVDGQGDLRALGVSLEGDRTRPVAISGGVGLRNSVYQARLALDKNLKPTGTNIFVSSQKDNPNIYGRY